MFLCRQGLAECGTDICCYACENQETCGNVCGKANDYKNCEDLEVTDIVSLEEKVPKVIESITNLMIQKKQLEKQEELVRKALQDAMERYNVKSFENEAIKVTYIAPTQRVSVDTTKLKKEHPEIAEAYQKVSQVKASVKIETR